jgi:hypothetical protein
VFFIKQNNMNLKHSQLDVDNWIKERRSLLQRLTNMALTEEVGEVARIIARRYGEQSERKR